MIVPRVEEAHRFSTFTYGEHVHGLVLRKVCAAVLCAALDMDDLIDQARALESHRSSQRGIRAGFRRICQSNRLPDAGLP